MRIQSLLLVVLSMKMVGALLHLQRIVKVSGVYHFTHAYFSCVGDGVTALTSDFVCQTCL